MPHSACNPQYRWIDFAHGRSLRKALDIAEDVGDLSFQMKALWGLFVERSVVGDYAVAATIARRFAAVAERLSLPISVGDGLLGLRCITVASMPRPSARRAGHSHCASRLRCRGAATTDTTTGPLPARSSAGFFGSRASQIKRLRLHAMSLRTPCHRTTLPRSASRWRWLHALSHSGSGIVTLADDMLTYCWSTRTRIHCAFGVAGVAVSISFGSGDTQLRVPPPRAFCPALRCQRRYSWIY